MKISSEARAWAELLLPVLVGLAIAGTGDRSAERWATALATMGLGGAQRLGFERGYGTYNPALREPPA